MADRLWSDAIGCVILKPVARTPSPPRGKPRLTSASTTLDEIGGKAIILREETAADITAIATVIQAAFGRPDEALLVDALRAAGVLTLSLVALADADGPGALAGVGGVVRFHPEFETVS